MENLNFCEHCGARLVAGANFCEVCGKQVSKPVAVQPNQVPPQQPAQPFQAPPPAQQAAPRVDPPYPEPAFVSAPPAPPAHSYQASPPKRKSILLPILGGGCCLGLLCGAVTAVGLIVFANTPEVQEITRMLTVEPAPVIEATSPPPPKQIEQLEQPSLPEELPTEAAARPTQAAVHEGFDADWSEDISQELSGTNFSDDFSSNQFGWADRVGESTQFSFEDGHYAIHIYEASYISWAYLPIEFEPSFVGFDAAVVPGQESGAYGVMCHYQDEDNYYFVSIDPGSKEYAIGYFAGGEVYELMQNLWMPSFYLNDSPNAVNNIQVACDPNMITLFINNQLEAQPQIETQYGGWAAIYGETWKEIGPDGFKVLFDNLYAFIPVQ